MHNLTLGLVKLFFRWVFRTTREDARNAGEHVLQAARALTSIGGRRLRDFLVAVPLFILFVRELVVQRERLDSKYEMLIVGAGASLGTLLTVVTISILTSLPFQIMLLVAHPIVGVAFFASSTLVVTSVVVLMVWLTMHVLNSAFEEDVIFIGIKNGFIPSREQALLSEVGANVSSSGINLPMLADITEAGLIKRGGTARPVQLINMLEDRARRKGFIRLKEAQAKDEIKERMRDASRNARDRAYSRVKERGRDLDS